jgi:hypothetical protein
MKDTRQESRAVRFQSVDFPEVAHARWALFFEDLQMPWVYRPQAFDLGDGEYVPDFWLSETGVWFHLGDALHDAGHLRWQRFAAAIAKGRPTAARESQHCGFPQPAERLPVTSAGLYSVGGIPGATTVAGGHWPRLAGGAAMYTADGSRCQWMFCTVCGWTGPAPIARATGGGSGHVHDHAVRVDAPRLLAAYRLARQANPAKETSGNGCARCRAPLALGDLITAGRKIQKRRWYHAICLLQSRRERYGTLPLPSEAGPERSREQEPPPAPGHPARSEAA